MSKPEKKLPLSDRVYANLSERIRTCEIRPGEMIFEPGLAAHYRVSKTPVREALARLIEEGVVTKYPRAGYLVNDIGLKDVLDGYHVRSVLEGDAAALAAQNITAEEIEYMESLPVIANPLGEYNREFHMTMVRASRNSRLVRLVRITYDDTYRLLALDPKLSASTGRDEDHERIVAVLKQHDPEAAREATTDHIKRGLTRVLQSMKLS